MAQGHVRRVVKPSAVDLPVGLGLKFDATCGLHPPNSENSHE